VKLGLIKLLQKRFDVCEEACVHDNSTSGMKTNSTLRRKNNATVQCPVEPGTYNVEQTVALPKEIPPGMACVHLITHLFTGLAAKFKIEVRGYTEANKDMVCVDLTVDFMKSPLWMLGR
jgi:hypothetical protein